MPVICAIADAMIGETCLPYRRMRLQAIRESTFDELHSALQGNFRRRREEGVHVIGHDYKFVQQEFSLAAIVRESVDKESGSSFRAKDWATLCGDGGDEENASEFHFAMVMEVGKRCL